uniref:Uncharacterized protein n=1 Tax=Chromera velia CCMP2878 TaxID=1169474 RepID=A0A0G4IEY5_9ALVE|eukprot:Cvel_13875.t1-p1 / transcript=Cvel_13875.t1 / gene=Cvel_13875 / organism=Chromera_velia_CCMP2878 / gene_product=hypothetical protein / transcript_product=hypothetical protein / location=Cvel_scaffold965:21886-23223(+) / protein_length=89 / sequence_SO=supercontig / SO=protein_coding / is_pseudo=false
MSGQEDYSAFVTDKCPICKKIAYDAPGCLHCPRCDVNVHDLLYNPYAVCSQCKNRVSEKCTKPECEKKRSKGDFPGKKSEQSGGKEPEA